MATSNLQRYMGDQLDKYFPQFKIRENYRPDWLMSMKSGNLEVDFYIEDLNIAIEVQGEQHYRFIPFFHKDYSEFENSKKRDAEKLTLCNLHGCRIVEIMTRTDVDVFINNLREKVQSTIGEPPKYNYQSEQFELMDFNELSEKKKKKLSIEYERAKRLAICKRNLLQYEAGLIEASDDKVNNWRRVVADNGYEPKKETQ